jgi:hypothetical protein
MIWWPKQIPTCGVRAVAALRMKSARGAIHGSGSYTPAGEPV